MFEQLFRDELQGLNADAPTIEKYWSEIKAAYTGRGRHYHNLVHLDNLAAQLLPIKNNIDDWPILVMAIAYHDIVYSIGNNDNEDKSAVVANERLKLVGVEARRLTKCILMIMATSGHKISDDSDTNYFTDADLSILGADKNSYLQYAAQIRKEYSKYPGFIYNPGRRKLLQRFLDMDHIYKTGWFRDKYEAQARLNLSEELKK
jgi:predicted metal-dependent HD superfamily phosphohydrolase